MKVFTVLLALFLAGSGMLLAQDATQPAGTKTPVINQRQRNQQRRIRQGVKSGSLTPREARTLERREAKIQADKKAAKSDGVVTPQERRKLRREENRTSRAIYRKKHNDRTQ